MTAALNVYGGLVLGAVIVAILVAAAAFLADEEED